VSIFKKKKEKPKIDVIGEEVLPLLEAIEPTLQAPCPMSMLFTRPCICMGCKFIRKCPMELVCRAQGCEHSYIGSCTNYQNEEDQYEADKRVIFHPGQTWDGGVVYFRSKRDKKEVKSSD
jgi:hypothetical protein